MAGPNLYDHDDYRVYLNDWIRYRQGKKQFSMRAFAKRAGFKAHNMFQLVASGQYDLTLKSIAKFAAGLGLSPDEQRYFTLLVQMNQSTNERDKIAHYEQLCAFPARRRVRPAERPRLSFFRSWLAPVIYEMIQFPDFRPDAAWIAQHLSEDVKATDIRHGLQVLIAADLVHVDANGKWSQRTPLLNTGDAVQNMVFFSYHQVALAKAADALDTLPVEQRQYRVLTSAIPAAAMDEIKALADRFENEFWNLVERQRAPRDQVVQFSFQIFPCTQEKS